MTRVTKMARKTHEEASGFVVTPLLPKSNSTGEQPDSTKKRKRKEEVVAAPTEAKKHKHAEKSSKEEKKKRKEKKSPEGTSDGPKVADSTEVSEKTPKPNKKRKGEDNSPAVGERQTDNTPAAPSTGGSAQKKKKMRHRSKAESTQGAGTSGGKRGKGKVAEDGLSKYEREALRRRTRREAMREKKMVCYLCRSMGHSIKFCPKATEQDKQAVSGICYKCGSTAHKSSECKKMVDPKNPYPFAHCFVCDQQGHLASLCPKNERGLYPNGGGCKYCGSVRHLARDCKPALQEAGITTLGTIDLKQGGDDDDVFVALHKMQGDKEKAAETTKPGTRKSSKKKVVKF
ncbi:uncharacterized protein SPPG_08271 [Spizellomyces punctatus DAOM BR117]|uniref:CCHC-type domain-containing protein n=1 Tax=Spizellomyces punctatus (strain DAOM BR117) TaxID=645134 RepID=A0A0L0H4D5_SPIPD|nr:uncharacterized protein SPPG_08271 [Spizellomyces punctatus DAOM BR117]KNC96370.1 hypothetical protein SPPG_08271 [Spizellomyces punctatus DAOM BR117]|eukprot:XP_016604410.1 hypothetical protein SPPG_08271 [Spizellomyces punctatus DAOM BR117]